MTHPCARTATGTEPLVLVPPTAPLNPAPRGAVLHRWSGTSMGSTWRLVLAAPPTAELAHLPSAVEARLARLVAELSHWEPDSALSRFNRLPEGTWQALTPDFAAVMRAGLALAEASVGAFDPALGDRITAWGFGPRGRFDQPGFAAPATCAQGLRQAQPEREGVPPSPFAASQSEGKEGEGLRQAQPEREGVPRSPFALSLSKGREDAGLRQAKPEREGVPPSPLALSLSKGREDAGLRQAKPEREGVPPSPFALSLSKGQEDAGPRQAQPEREGVPLSPFALSLSKGLSRTWRDLQLRGDHLLQPGGCVLDFSAIAKGHAVDVVVALLRQLGFGHFLFELGGELAGEGLKPDGQPWWVALERPPGAGASLPPLRAALVGMSMATSGDYRQGFTDHHGRWCSHTLDPRTGEPVRHTLASVSVLHERCMQADALATLLFVLGPDEGDAWARAHGVATWFVARTPDGGWREWPSPALAEWLD